MVAFKPQRQSTQVVPTIMQTTKAQIFTLWSLEEKICWVLLWNTCAGHWASLCVEETCSVSTQTLPSPFHNTTRLAHNVNHTEKELTQTDPQCTLIQNRVHPMSLPDNTSSGRHVWTWERLKRKLFPSPSTPHWGCFSVLQGGSQDGEDVELNSL